MSKGNFRNMASMVKNAKKIQKDMLKAQERISEQVVDASSGGGAIKCSANGKKEIVNIKIDKEVIDPNDPEMLEDLVMTAVNAALTKADEVVAKEMAEVTGGLNIPGL